MNSDLDQNFNKGDSIVHSASGKGLSSLSAGDWVHFVKYNFDYGIPQTDENYVADIVGQITQLESTGTDGTGKWGEIKDVANMDYVDSTDPSYSLKICKITPVKNIGIENLKISRTPNTKATDSYYNVKIDYAVNCWIRGVESYKPSRSHLSVSYSSHLEISGCYFHEATDYCEGGWGYGVAVGYSTTNCLVENNIFRSLRHSLVAYAGSNCNVWAFNYSREQTWTQPGLPTYRDLDLHAKYPFGHLFEHNMVEQIGADDCHGDNGPYNAFVRNYSYDGNINFEDMEYWSVLGNIGFWNSSTNEINASWINYTDTPITDVFGFFNNYTTGYSHNVCHTHYWDNNSELLDVSYYYSNRPDFLQSSYTWPSIGPKISSTYLSQSIPARARFNNSKKTYLPNPTPKPLAFSGDLSYSQTWSGTHTLTGDVTVPAGITLTILPGTTIWIPASKSINIEGTLIAQGTSADSIFFDSVSGTWSGLNFKNSSADADCILEYCDIQHATHGVYLNSAGPTIQHCSFHHNTYGFYAYNANATSAVTVEDNVFRNNTYDLYFSYPSSSFYVENNDSYANTSRNVYLYCCDDHVEVASNNIYDSSDLGIYLFDSEPHVYNNDIYQNDGNGIACYYGSHFELYSDAYYGHNSITNNDDNGIYIDANSRPILGSCNYSGTANEFDGNANYNVYSLQTLQVSAVCNIWNGTPNIYGNVDTSNPLGKAVVKELEYNGDPEARDQLNVGYRQMLNKEFSLAGNTFKSVVTHYPDDHAAWMALTFLNSCYHRAETKDNTLFSFFASIMNTNKGIVGGKARELYAKHLHKTGQFDKALQMYADLDKQFPKTDLAKKALYDTWMVNYFQINDPDAALAARQKLEATYPNDEWVYMIKTAMGEKAELPDSFPSADKKIVDEQKEKTVKKFTVYSNFPNPFNPATRISFDIPKADRTVIDIFDVQGRRVKTCLNSLLESGHHSVVWHGKDTYGNQVASGMYFYQIRYGTHIVTRKMLLMR